jgi:DNA-binding CsgD family transcriptional regulator
MDPNIGRMLCSRDRELDAIDGLLASARAGRGGCLLLQGEPGIGKTALLACARTHAASMRVLSASGVSDEAALAYATLHQLVRGLLDGVGRLPEPQARALGVALGIEPGPAPDRFLVSLATLTLLSEAATEQPLLCLLDDAQHADGPSLEVVGFLARRLEADAIALLVTVRSGAGDLPQLEGVDRLTVTGLAPDAAAALLDERWGAGLAGRVRDALVVETRGNPLALLEVPPALTSDQRRGLRPLPDPMPVAGGLERVFRGQVDELRPELRTLALLCACEGSGAVPTVLRAAAGLGVDEGVPELAELTSLLEVRDARVVFRHPLARSAVYHGAEAAERRAAHLALADALAGDEGEVDRRAWHRAEAAVGPDEAVADELERSAEHALARSGHAAAALVLERAADLSAAEPSRGRRLVAAAGAAWRSGDAAKTRALTDRAERIGALEPALRLRARYLRGQIELRSGVPADALHVLLAPAEDAMDVDADLACQLLISASEAAFQAGELGSTAVVINRLLAALPEDLSPENALLVRLFLSVNPAGWGGRPASPDDDFARTEELDDPDLLARAGNWAFGRGAYALAHRLRARSVGRARAVGAAGTLAWALRALALDELFHARYLWASASAAEGYRLARETGQPNLACQHQAILAEVAGLRGEDAEADRLVRELLEEATGRGLHGTVRMVRRLLGHLALARGDPDEALRQLEPLSSPPAGQGGLAFATIPDLVEAAVRAGRPELCAERLPAYVAWAEGSGSAEDRAVAARLRALVADTSEAGGWYEEALRLHPATERPLDTARTALLYGEHLRRRRRRADARVQLRAAQEAFERLGAAHWAARARTELRATGETARRRDPSTLDRLTKQELQVVRHIAEGATNREAAAQLFVSPRTVDHHLRSVFRKLAIRSRAELVRLALAGGLDAGP